MKRFERNLPEYKDISFNEAKTRQHFINPFFNALGWDMINEQGLSESSTEVVHEATLKIGNTTKAPDYAFRIGESTKFFVEAKKPHVNLAENPAPAYQLRYYAWNAKLPISVLIDFEEFRVYDCRYPPNVTDSADTALLFALKYTDYNGQWEKISNIFSKAAILNGSFDKYVDKSKNKIQTKEVDVAFLEAISAWRNDLANDIAGSNELSVEELNTNVQNTIDRIVFLRICEDRGIERYGQIQEIATQENIYAGLCNLFRHADDRYNSGLFHFKKEPAREDPDLLALDLKINNAVLKDIISSLYPPNPYNFAIIPPEILGEVYEQFLGKVIRLTDEGGAEVQYKPDVKKAGGVKYTPAYIVQYMVRAILGPLLKDKTPIEVTLIRVLDPACGSGSFLLVVYKHLLDWHLDWYVRNLAPVLDDGHSVTSAAVKKLLPFTIEEPNDEETQKAKRGAKAKRIKAKAETRAATASIPIYKTYDGKWHLKISERKRILLNNIYGVDIDQQAVEVTKLSLLLKVLEGENQQTVADLLKYSRERALPDLGNNIKCGNSLIGWNILNDRPNLSREDIERINPFDWDKEFPEVFQNGGFSVVIGNPPYVRQETLGEFKGYFKKHYNVYHGTADLYTYFMERGVSLLKVGGVFSYIVANKWMRANYGQPLRRWLKGQRIEEIIDFGDLPVFEGVTTYPCIIRTTKNQPCDSFDATQVKTLDFQSLSDYIKENHHSVKQSALDDSCLSLADERTQDLLTKLRSKGVPLGEYVGGKVNYGIKTGLNEAFVIDSKTREKLIAEDPRSAEIIKPFLAGRDIKRYQLPESDKYLIFTRHGINIIDYPAVQNHLLQFKDRLMPKPKDWNGKEWNGRKPGAYQWYEIQDTVDYYAEFEGPKILYLVFQVKPAFTFDDTGTYGNNAIWIIPGSNKYLLGILNSKPGWFMISNYCTQIQSGYQLIFDYLGKVPIRAIDFSDPQDVTRHDRMVSMVDQMLSLNKQLQEARTPHEKTALQRQIEATDRQIDSLVYELYGLTEDEIGIVEGKR